MLKFAKVDDLVRVYDYTAILMLPFPTLTLRDFGANKKYQKFQNATLCSPVTLALYFLFVNPILVAAEAIVREGGSHVGGGGARQGRRRRVEGAVA